jgi:hypothetical protein
MVGQWRVQQAARVVRQGGVIAYPTEAVWGLGCDPWSAAAVYRLLALKQRPVEKGLILVAADIGQFDFLLADLPAAWLARLEQSWPGPNTWLVPHHNRLPEWISGVHDSAGARAVRAYRAAGVDLGQPGRAPGGAFAPARRAVLRRPAGWRARRRPGRAAQPQPDPRPAHGTGDPPVLTILPPAVYGSRMVEPTVCRELRAICAWAASARA